MNDDEFRQAMATLEAYKVQLDAMAQQSNFFKLSLEETMRARDTLRAFANANEGDEILVPAGASSFVIATVTSKKKAIVGIGNKVSIDMDLTEAADYMASSCTLYASRVAIAWRNSSSFISCTDLVLDNVVLDFVCGELFDLGDVDLPPLELVLASDC